MRKACLDCGRLTDGPSRCPTHEAQRNANRPGREKYRGGWAGYSRKAIAAHLAENGPVCPGWGVEPHLVDPGEFVTDHQIGPCCRSCNSRKAALSDRPKAQERRGRA